MAQIITKLDDARLQVTRVALKRMHDSRLDIDETVRRTRATIDGTRDLIDAIDRARCAMTPELRGQIARFLHDHKDDDQSNGTKT